MMTEKEAKDLYETGFWESMTKAEITEFQLFEDRLCMPFGVFHEAVEKTLGRPVWTHEFAYSDNLKAEFLGDREAPSFQQIMELIPADKRMLVVSP